MKRSSALWLLFSVCAAVALATSSCNEEVTSSSEPFGEISIQNLFFDEGVDELSFEIANSGGTTMHWEVNNKPTWLTVLPRSGSIRPGLTSTVTATANRSGLDIGVLTGELEISVSSAQASLRLPVSVNVPEIAILTLNASTLFFDFLEYEAELTIGNAGNDPLTWTATPSETYVGVTPLGGTLTAGDSTTVTVSVDRAQLDLLTESGEAVYTASIEFSAPAQTPAAVDVTVNHFKENLERLNHIVLDAEYDRAHDVIVSVSVSPPRLHRFDPDLEPLDVQSLDLPLAPRCVSVRPDGAMAAVGHNGFLTLVDLSTMSIVGQPFNVSADIGDVVLAANGWAYCFPAGGQWTEIRCIRVADGQEFLHTGFASINERTRARLHPSGDYIYGANNGLSPSDAEKYDIRNGVADYLYDSPYHGDHAFSGDLWFSEDGALMYVRAGNVFRLSEVQAEDMIYNGALETAAMENASPVLSVAHSSAAGRIFVIEGGDYLSDPVPEVLVYSDDFFALRGSYRMPEYWIDDPFDLLDNNSYGSYVFVNSTGTRFYILAHNHEDLGPPVWAVVARDIDQSVP
jgi:hypothetical protein